MRKLTLLVVCAGILFAFLPASALTNPEILTMSATDDHKIACGGDGEVLALNRVFPTAAQIWGLENCEYVEIQIWNYDKMSEAEKQAGWQDLNANFVTHASWTCDGPSCQHELKRKCGDVAFHQNQNNNYVNIAEDICMSNTSYSPGFLGGCECPCWTKGYSSGTEDIWQMENTCGWAFDEPDDPCGSGGPCTYGLCYDECQCHKRNHGCNNPMCCPYSPCFNPTLCV